MESTSSTLINGLRQTNHEAWSKFVRLYTPLIFHWARRTGLQPADAADLVQEVFATLVTKLPEFQYDKSKSFRSWLRTVTLNKWREHRRRRSLPACQADDELLDAGTESELEKLWDCEYQRHWLLKGMQTVESEFPRQAWQAFQQYAIQGRPVAEVAKEVNMSVSGVYAAKSRIISRLRQILGGVIDLD